MIYKHVLNCLNYHITCSAYCDNCLSPKKCTEPNKCVCSLGWSGADCSAGEYAWLSTLAMRNLVPYTSHICLTLPL